MDIGTISISAMLALACALPFVIMYKKKINKKHELNNHIEQLAKTHQCTLSMKEVYGNFALGVDQEAKQVFFYQHQKDEALKLSINLKQVARCKGAITYAPSDPKNPNDREIDRVELLFHPSAKAAVPQSFVLFDVDENFQLADELSILEKWETHLNNIIKAE